MTSLGFTSVMFSLYFTFEGYFVDNTPFMISFIGALISISYNAAVYGPGIYLIHKGRQNK